MVADDSELLDELKNILKQETPLLPRNELLSCVNYHMGRRDKYLQALEKGPLPVYILESDVLEEKARQFQTVFKKALPEVSFYYAVKSNNHPAVAGTLLKCGFGLDVSSGLELEMGLDLDSHDMVFSGPGKTNQELDLATQHAEDVVVLIDSFGELYRLENIAASKKKEVRAGVRLTTDTNGLWRKFGISTRDLPFFWKEARQCRHVLLQGLQFHTSWNLSPEKQIDFIEVLGKSFEEMSPYLREDIVFIDIGGGYWPPQGEWLLNSGTPAGKIRNALGKGADPNSNLYRLPATPIESFAEQLGSAIYEHILKYKSCRICLEPGRWICSDAMHIFISVVDKKASNLVITDGGTNAVGWEQFKQEYSPILNLTRPSLKEQACDVLGSLCTPHDVWGYSYWGDDIQPGDLLMVPAQGAYTYSFRQEFIKPVPPVIII
ncbi:MAG: alanine racemase [Thermodesulfobacteriota bacterium]|nr:alanine racemase [Thermodesulfobacteriota bacterium]